MSAEAPRNSGREEPIHSQRPDGGFSRFLRRFIGQPQAVQQLTPRVIQSPPGLEDFASRVQTGINDQLELKRQQGLEKILESQRMATRVAELRADEQRRINEIEERERSAAAEGAKILNGLRVAERLKYIQDSVWEGKGQIRSTVGVRSLYHGSQSLATMELNHQYPALRVIQEYIPDYSESGGSPNSQWQYVPAIGSTRLIVDVVDLGVTQRVPNINIRVFSEVKLDREVNGEYYAEVCSVFIPAGTRTTEQQLETALVQETASRVNRNFIPPRLEEREKEALLKAKRSHAWQKWVSGTYWQTGEGLSRSIGYH